MGEVIDAIQRLFRCCGDTGKENYYAEVLPSSCCWNENCSSGIVYDGCNTKVPEMVVDLGWPIFGIQNLCFIAIAAIAGVIKLLGGILALIILHCDKKNRE
ncbi:uncharacterized protein LOC122850634 [Aphidius gifuensis]|uniref:uncharacterized protein LOC122850634 n=1 Tax=Aphidius gifuensis TaxID=684658 RepID=UPI001CDBBE96|nr:uncharacterized protein LOC122850634 [Aphidius gifuensis]